MNLINCKTKCREKSFNEMKTSSNVGIIKKNFCKDKKMKTSFL